jgi:predicted MFS family arabinose efflux permease
MATIARGMQVWMLFVGLPLVVLRLGGGPAEIGLVNGLFLLPVAFIAPLGGVIGDRIDRRRALMAMAVFGAIHGAVLATLVLAGVMTIPLLVVFSLVYGILNAAEIPIRLAFVAEVVPASDLSNGIVLGSAALTTTRIVGPAVAGVVTATVGLAPLFVIIAAAALVTAAAMFTVRRFAHEPTPVEPIVSVREALTVGLRYGTRTPSIRGPLWLLGVAAIFGLSFQAILPIVATERLGLDASQFGSMLAVMGVGAIVSAGPMAFIRPEHARRVMLASASVLSVAVASLAVTTLVPAAFALALVAGAAGSVTLGSVSVAIQDAVAGHLRARILGLQAALFQGGIGLGGMAMGLSTARVGVEATMLVGAAVVGLMAIATALIWFRAGR